MKMYLLYSCDTWLSTSSLCLLAVCTTQEKAIELAVEHSNQGEEPLLPIERELLSDINQTNGRDENYLIAPVEVDELD